MSDKSTARPWFLSKIGLLTNDGQRAIMSADPERGNVRIALVDLQREDVKRGQKWDAADPVRDANAELICKAVNQYDHVAELVSSLRELKELLKHGSEYSISRIDGKPMGLGEVIPIGEIFLRADAALAKMEVQP